MPAIHVNDYLYETHARNDKIRFSSAQGTQPAVQNIVNIAISN